MLHKQGVQVVETPGFIEDGDKAGVCIWRGHPELQKRFLALMSLDINRRGSGRWYKKRSQVADLTHELERLAMSLTDIVKKGRILSKASDINCHLAVAYRLRGETAF